MLVDRVVALHINYNIIIMLKPHEFHAFSVRRIRRQT